jgi:hypothetical protein
MIERKRYLELCQMNSVYPKSVVVLFNNGKYHPLALKIWFNGDGATKNTAEMMDAVSHTKLYCDIKDICES